jgi:hypothetical protein
MVDFLAAVAFTRGQPQRPATGVKILRGERDQLPVSRASVQRRLYQRPKFRLTGVDQPGGFGVAQIADACAVDTAERLHPPPFVSVWHLAFAKGMVERRPQHRECPVGGGAPRPRTVGVTLAPVFLPLARRGAQPRCGPHQTIAPAPQQLGGQGRRLDCTERRSDQRVVRGSAHP